jgi:hypothetical protein
MGIQNYQKYIDTNHKECYIKKRVFDHIYIDLNYIMHYCIYHCKKEEQFINRIIANLDSILLDKCIAKKSIVITIDGPCTYSKINLQRKRRLSMIRHTNPKENIKNINSLHLTPGTTLLDTLERYLEEIYIPKLKSLYKLFKINIRLSKSSEPNEGEIKLVQDIYKNNINNNSSHLILGNDADLIVIATSIFQVDNIFVGIKRLDNTIDILSVDILINKIKNLCKLYHENIRLDYALVSIIMGNDYLSKLSFIKDKLWNSYFETIKNTNNTIITFVNNEITFNLDVFIDFLFNIMENTSKNFNKFNYNSYNEDKIKSYLEGLLWCLNMYMTGICSKIDYEYKYNSVNPNDLLLYLIKLKETNTNINIPKSNITYIELEKYAIFIMPQKASVLLSNKYQNTLVTLEQELKFIYVEENCVKCIEFHCLLSEYHKKLCNKKTTEDEKTKIKSNIGSLSKSMIQHKIIHPKYLDIEKVRNILI